MTKAPRLGLLLLLVTVAAVLPFVGALGGPFLWDDTHLIENNPRVHTLSHASRLFAQSYFDTGTNAGAQFLAYYRPLPQLSYAVDWVLGRGNPVVFHATNLLLAMLVAWLAAKCLVRWTRDTRGALLCALVFAWHPSKVESVAWISGRTDLLVATFMLLACEAHSKGLGRSRAWAGVELLASLCAFASKETAILLPALISIEHYAAHPAVSEPGWWRSLLRSTRLHWSGALAYLVLRFTAFPLVPPGPSSADQFSLTTRLGLAFETIGRASQLLFYPHRQSAEHGLASFDQHGQLSLHGPHVILGVVFFVAVCACILLTRRRTPAVALACATLLLTLLPTANLVPTQLQCVFYERFLFLPTLALAWLIVVATRPLSTNRLAWRAYLAAIVGVLVLFAIRCTMRTSDYANETRFWSHEIAMNPLSTVAQQGLSNHARASGRFDTAVSHLNQCHVNAVTRRQHRTAIRCAYDAAVLSTENTPDVDRQGLAAAERFFTAFAEPGSHRSAQLELAGLAVSVDTSTPAMKSLVRELRGESLAVLASIELRLNRPRATEHARLALTHCRKCLYALRAARVLAATGHIEEALNITDVVQSEGALHLAALVQTQLRQYAHWTARAAATRGPEHVHSRAQGYLALGLYGAAYAVLKPHWQEFRSITSMNLQYAQVAYYAGDTAAARETLLEMVGSETTEVLLATWSKSQTPSQL